MKQAAAQQPELLENDGERQEESKCQRGRQEGGGR